jgi:peptide/nickel transport system permease protein
MSARLRRWVRSEPLSALGVGVALVLVGLSLFAPLLAPHDPTAINLAAALQPPGGAHLLGTDKLGRDLLSRLLWAGRSSLTVVAATLLLSLLLGLLVGIASGFRGGWLDDLTMRLTDLFHALPQLVLALALIGAMGPGTLALIVALAATGWVRYARLARSLVLALRNEDFVLAARALGAPDGLIMRRHMLPHVLGPLAVQVSLDAGATALAVAGLSFLGLGIQPPTPEWGMMLVEARPYLNSAPHLVLPPGLAIFLIVFGCNALAEGLDARGRPQYH